MLRLLQALRLSLLEDTHSDFEYDSDEREILPFQLKRVLKTHDRSKILQCRHSSANLHSGILQWYLRLASLGVLAHTLSAHHVHICANGVIWFSSP